MVELSFARCIILGAGGHARVLIDCLRSSGYAEPCVLLDADRSRWGGDVLGVEILGGDDLLPGLVKNGAEHFIVGLGATGDNRPRQRLFELALSARLQPLTVIHSSAVCSQWTITGPGVQMLPSCVVNAGATLGANVIVNSGAIVEHDCTLGDHVHVATGARLASTVQIGTGAHVGAGATVKQGVRIGEWAIVGAGAVVVKDVAPNTTVVGVPAKALQ